MNIKLYNQKREEVGQAKLPKEIFEVPMNSDLVRQVAVSQISNKRQKTAKTKDRGEVRGGGKKPWRQKGTGRARHGSIRSPLWKGGGVTFGPVLEKVLKKTIPNKMRRKALFMVLSSKVKDDCLFVLDNLNIEKPKTKIMAEVLDKFFEKKSGLVVLPNMEKNAILASRNIPKAKAIQAKDLNALDLLNHKYLLMPKESIKVMQETFIKKD
jgi:large subunit ribosomal protein L4